MPIKLAQSEKFKANVDIEVANEKGGWDNNRCQIIFFRADSEEVEELAKGDNKALLRKKVAGWNDVLDDDGGQVPFSVDNLEALMLIPAAVSKIAQAFWESQVKVKKGN